MDLTAGGSASVTADHSDTVTPGGPTGDAAPAGAHGKESTLVDSSDDPSSDEDAKAGPVGSAGADDDSVGGSAIGRGGRGGNGNGRGRNGRESDDNGLAIGNDDGQGGVDGGGDGDNGGGCHGHGHRHSHGDHHGGHDHGGRN